MAKTTKRKSEGDLPNDHLKSKFHKAARASDISDASRQEDLSKDELFLSELSKPKYVKNKKKSRKSEPARKVDEYEEDTGRMESQKFIDLITQETKKKKKAAKQNNEYIERLTKLIKEEGQELRERIQNLCSISAKQNDSFLAAFKSAYDASRPQNGPKTFASLYEHSGNITSNASRIVEEFEKLDKQTVAVDRNHFMTNDWVKDSENIAKILELGRQAGWEKYKALLLDQDRSEVGEGEEEILSHIYSDFLGGEDLAIGWGKIAKKQAKAAKKMVKASLLNGAA